MKKAEKMIILEVRFWTNNLAPKGGIRPKHAWSSGMVRMRANKAHSIRARRTKPFSTPFDLPAVIEKVLIENGIVLHANRKMKKYLTV